MASSVLTTFDIVVFVAALVGVMGVGLFVGRKEETSEDYFLAGRKLPWWGVAGSIFGSNVSANHMVGMLGVGASIGFAQSHFELGAIFGLLFLCYGFLPVYRKLKVYTLSEYLGRRFDDHSRLSYAVIMLVIMVLVQMVPGLYIGSRAICLLVGGPAIEASAEPVDDAKPETKTEESTAAAGKPAKTLVKRSWYVSFVLALAAVSALYTIFGGLTAVVWTDVIQSVLLLVAGVVVAFLTFSELGGWAEMMAQEGAAEKMSLYKPPNHGTFPFTGVFTGLIAMHLYYWGTNQFIVQRALGARSDEEARIGIVFAGFLKLLIPFFAVAAGVAGAYLFKAKLPGEVVDPDAMFPRLVTLLISPLGFGIVGLIMAGLIGAILSSIDSMMNSSATIFSVDIYQKFLRPEASDKEMIWVGRLSVLGFVSLATVLALTVMDPNSQGNFFITIANYQNYFTPGLLVAFLMGMFWKRTTSAAALLTIVAGVVFSWGVEQSYNSVYGMDKAAYSVHVGGAAPDEIENGNWPKALQTESKPDAALIAARGDFLDDQKAKVNAVNTMFGPNLAFFHRVVIVIGLCLILCVVVSFLTDMDPEKSLLTWTELGGHSRSGLLMFFGQIFVSILLFAVLGYLVYSESLTPLVAGLLASAWTVLMYIPAVIRQAKTIPMWKCDRLYAGILCASAVFVHYYFY